MMEPICEILYKDAHDRAHKEKQSAKEVSLFLNKVNNFD